jgi:orotidine-5'-phosphate decarboxylase
VSGSSREQARERVALAADVPLERGLSLYQALTAYVGVVKVGLSLFVEHGPAAVQRFQTQGARVFLDLKLHDIPNTVGLAAEQAGALGIAFLTVHASGGMAMMRAAKEGSARGASRAGILAPRVLAVTVLTSMSEQDLIGLGVEGGMARQVDRLGELAARSGVDGLVCSPQEVTALRAAYPGLFLCTPGIRPAGSAQGDQARAEAPLDALRAGSDLLVVGRPLYEAADPRKVGMQLMAELEGFSRPG